MPNPIVFPVVGPVEYGNDYGDARAQGGHEGNDVMAPRRAVAVATEAGTVKFHTTSSRAGCMLYLYGESGTTYLYIHLNNDVGKGNDNRGKCVPGTAYAPGLATGDTVEAGEPVGLVGDSGDADGGASHLHFEIHPGDGGPTNPFRHLNRATKLLFSAPAGSAVTLSVTGAVTGADDGTLTIKVDTAVVFPLGVQLSKLRKPLRLQLPASTLVDPGSSTDRTGFLTKGAAALVGRAVVVLTEPAAATVDTQAGRDGAFVASRVVVR